MPQERENQYPHMTPEGWQEIVSTTARETVASRALMARNISGVPKRPFLAGDNDASPIRQGLEEFTAKVYALLDSLDHIDGGMPAVVEDAASEVARMMEDPRL